MKKQLLILTALLLLFSLAIQAQDVKPIKGKKFKVGLSLEAALPVETCGQTSSFGGGLSLRFLYKISPKFGATFTTGFIIFPPKNPNNLSSSKVSLNIPFKLGGRYMFTDKFYEILEVGITHTITHYNAASGRGTYIYGNSFTYAPGIGLLLGRFDASLRYERYGSAGFIGLGLSYFF